MLPSLICFSFLLQANGNRNNKQHGKPGKKETTNHFWSETFPVAFVDSK
jgi:hypothetical protein